MQQKPLFFSRLVIVDFYQRRVWVTWDNKFAGKVAGNDGRILTEKDGTKSTEAKRIQSYLDSKQLC